MCITLIYSNCEYLLPIGIAHKDYSTNYVFARIRNIFGTPRANDESVFFYILWSDKNDGFLFLLLNAVPTRKILVVPTCLLAFVDVVAFKIIKILLYCCVAAMVMLVCYILWLNKEHRLTTEEQQLHLIKLALQTLGKM